MDNIIIRNRKEEFKELVLYTFFGNMTFVISIGSYAIFNVFFGINELIANALAWVFAVLFSSGEESASGRARTGQHQPLLATAFETGGQRQQKPCRQNLGE